MSIPPTIAPGSTDVATVIAAQRDLNVADARDRSAGRTGLTTCPLTENGIFDPQMAAAVIEFQALHGLFPDAIIDPSTWGALEPIVNPASGVSSGGSFPLEGVTRWSVSLADIAQAAGQAPSSDQLDGVTVSIGSSDAVNTRVSPDGAVIYFTPPAGEEGATDLTVSTQDGNTFVLPNAVRYTASFGAGLEGVVIAVALAIQEAAVTAAANEVGRLRAYCDGVAAALDPYQDLITNMLNRLQDPNSGATEEDGAAWLGHIITRAGMVADLVNSQCRITLQTDAIADLDGLPFGGADDEPTLDTGATVLLMTAIENVIVPSIVDLTA